MPDVCLVEAGGLDVLPYTYLPEELLSTASVLDRAGLDVAVYHPGQEIPPSATLVVSASMIQYKSAIGIAKQGSGMRTILCGDYVTAATADAMCKPLFDVGIIGDPEVPILELLTGRKPKATPGVVYWHRGILVANPKVDLLRFPPLAYHTWQGPWGKSVNVSKVREYTLRDDQWRFRGRRGLKNYLVLDKQISQLKNRGVEHVVLTDRDFSGASMQVKSTVQTMDRLDSWQCSATTKTALNSKLGESLKSSHCSKFVLFAETACDRLAWEIGSASLKEHELAFGELGKVVGKNIEVHVTVGYPGETVVSMNETRDWLRTCVDRGYLTHVRTYLSLPGMDSYEEPNKFDRFGFEVVGIDCDDFWVDDSKYVFKLPWRSATISLQDFLGLRNKMIEEFNGGTL